MKIAITGRMCSGKSFLAEHLCTKYKFHKFAFADKIKALASELFQMKGKDRVLLQTLGDKMKNIDGDIQYIDEIFKNSYNDEKASWHGSLVTGEQASGEPKSPPIKIPKLTQKDIDDHYYKTTHFPKDLGDVQNFP